jgi:PAS domain S-box-containing protein
MSSFNVDKGGVLGMARRYLIAVLSVVTALLLSQWSPIHLESAPVSLFLCAVMVSAWFGGVGPGLLATLLSSIAFYHGFLPPMHSFVSKPDQMPRFLAFVVSVLVVGSLSVAQRWAAQSLRIARDDLTETVIELQRTNESLHQEIAERQRAEQARQEIEEQWKAAFESNPTMYFIVDSQGAIVTVNTLGAEQLGYTVEELVGQPVSNVFYESYRSVVQKHAQECFDQPGRNVTWEARKIRKDGAMLWVRETGNVVFLKKRPVLLVVCEDISEQKRAEEAARRNYEALVKSEAYLAEAQTLSHTGSAGWNVSTGELFWSDETFRIFGYERSFKPTIEKILQRVHPDDLARVQQALEAASHGEKLDIENRLLMPDGSVKTIHVQGAAQNQEVTGFSELVGAVTDITTVKNAFEEIRTLRDQLYKENLALREEIDITRMFEEIVGSSPALQAVLSQVARVAPTDSTVLVTGETGTGKELIARAIHKRSQRSSRAFVSVNCAAIPRDLIASELFGHEKGAFTGATQRRLGRFESAEGGTIFLDEIGELPAEMQILLLRVLQEREFQRVGGNESLAVDVRVVAATNRDLQAAIAEGEFREDLFYRLNVFPIQVPPLRNRKEDIPLLVQYFVDRYASKAGKNITGINKRSLELLHSYAWPGNIRELQNVIERSVIISDSQDLSMDESWLGQGAPIASSQAQPLSERLAAQEREIIEAALAESKGRVSGPSGAAAKLGMPQSTLDSKIKSLKINKHQFKNT